MYAPLLEDRCASLPRLQDVTTDLQINNPRSEVEIDRDKAATLGVSAEQIEDALYTAYGSRQISTIYAPNNQYQVILELQPEYQMDPRCALHALRSVLRAANWCRWIRVAKLTQGVGPLTVNHSGTASRGDHLLQPQAGVRFG